MLPTKKGCGRERGIRVRVKGQGLGLGAGYQGQSVLRGLSMYTTQIT
jgi:hypothetical protein